MPTMSSEAFHSSKFKDALFTISAKQEKFPKKAYSLSRDYNILLCMNFLWGLPYTPCFLSGSSCDAPVNFWTILTALLNIFRTLATVYVLLNSHLIFKSYSVRLTFDVFVILSTAVLWAMFLKRQHVLQAIKLIIAVTDQVSTRAFRSRWNVCFFVFLNIIAIGVFCTTVTFTSLHAYRNANVSTETFLSLEVREDYRDLFLMSLAVSSTVVFMSNGIACSLATQLCSAAFYHLGDIVANFGTKLERRFEYQQFSQEAFSENLKMFRRIAELTYAVNNAFSACALFVYGASMSIFLTGICSFSSSKTSDDLLSAILVLCMCCFSFYCFLSITITGDRLGQKHNQLKDIVSTCSNLVISSDLDERGIARFSLMAKEIRSSDLHVTGGNMFVITYSLILVSLGNLITYGMIIFQQD